jgi:WD repeat-containing protein 68
MVTAGDDFKVNVWDLKGPEPMEAGDNAPFLEPMFTYFAENEVTAIQWPITNPEWIGIAFGKKVQVLKI